jgi:hypothetical protein
MIKIANLLGSVFLSQSRTLVAWLNCFIKRHEIIKNVPARAWVGGRLGMHHNHIAQPKPQPLISLQQIGHQPLKLIWSHISPFLKPSLMRFFYCLGMSLLKSWTKWTSAYLRAKINLICGTIFYT